MSVSPLFARGANVWVETVNAADIEPYRRAVALSARRIGEWNPVSADDLPWRIDRQTLDNRTFMIHAADSEGEHGIVGKVNVSNVVRGRFQSGTMGYDSYDPYAGRGLFGEGMRLIIGLAFAPAPRGMGLHRLEANVRPGNATSAGVLRSLGFRREGHVRDMLLLDGSDGQMRWRDHDSYALVASDWPTARAYRANAPFRMSLIVNGFPPEIGSAIGRAMSAELGIPLFCAATVPDPAMRWSLLAASPAGAVVEGSFGAADLASVRDGLSRAGVDPRAVPCVCPGGGERVDLGGPAMPVDPARLREPREATRLALAARAAYVARA